MQGGKEMQNKRIISAALTGNWGNKSNNPALPITPKEIAESAYEAVQAGAAVVHLHMRDEEGHPTMRADRFLETIALINELDAQDSFRKQPTAP